MGFLSISTADVDAICARLLCRNDEVLVVTRGELEGLPQPAGGIFLETSHYTLSDNARLEQSVIFDVAKNPMNRSMY